MEGSTKEATLTVRIDLTEGGRDEKVEKEIILNPSEARKAFGVFNTYNGMPLSNSARLFNGKSEAPNKWCDLSIDGFSIPRLEDETDLWWNRKAGPSRPGLLVQALTEDGKGGFMNWGSRRQEPCLRYTIENIFLRPPKNVVLEIPPAMHNVRLHSGIYRGQQQNLQEWLDNDYAPRIASCFTHRPITEAYFIDLQHSELADFERESKGRALFGAVNYEILKKYRAVIEDRHQ
jgi:hypothetical protein